MTDAQIRLGRTNTRRGRHRRQAARYSAARVLAVDRRGPLATEAIDSGLTPDYTALLPPLFPQRPDVLRNLLRRVWAVSLAQSHTPLTVGLGPDRARTGTAGTVVGTRTRVVGTRTRVARTRTRTSGTGTSGTSITS